MKPTQSPARLRRAFTMLEMMIVVALLAVVMALVGAVWGHLRKQSEQSTCINHIRQVGSALLLFVGDHQNTFPHSAEFTTPLQAKIWAGRLFHEGYLNDLKVFYCPAHPKRYRVEHQVLLNSPINVWANISYGANKFGLMPNNRYPSLQRRARLTELRNPSKILMLAEARVMAQNPGGWHEFYADFAAAADPANPDTIVVGRHSEAATLMFCDGHVEVANVRNDLYQRTTLTRNPPWCYGIYTTP